MLALLCIPQVTAGSHSCKAGQAVTALPPDTAPMTKLVWLKGGISLSVKRPGGRKCFSCRRVYHLACEMLWDQKTNLTRILDAFPCCMGGFSANIMWATSREPHIALLRPFDFQQLPSWLYVCKPFASHSVVELSSVLPLPPLHLHQSE